MEAIPGFRDVWAARRPVYAHLQPTPLLFQPGLSELVGARIWLKHENHLPTGAFKVRGGLNLVSGLDGAERRAGLYTASTGNHGQSIAFAGRTLGARVTIAVPEGANPAKVAAMRALGAEVAFHGPDYDAAREWIEARAREKGGRTIGPTDPELVAGVGTYALEILEALPDVETILVPVGAGSGACGTCLVAKTLAPGAEVIGVQAEAAPTQYRSWRERRPVHAPMETVAEGLATRVPFENVQRILTHPRYGLDDFVLVSDAAMEEAIRLLLEHGRTLAEHAGAASLAAALALRERLRGRRVVLVVSGGNLSLDALSRILVDDSLSSGSDSRRPRNGMKHDG
jgi:threonine dehydratase